MQNRFLRDLTAADINDQVNKVLKGLGNPGPHVDLNDVRQLLRLDRGYYSSTEDGIFQEAMSRITVAGRQVWERPGILLDALKKFDLRAQLELLDVNGTGHVFEFETFYNQYDALTIGVYIRKSERLIAVGDRSTLI